MVFDLRGALLKKEERESARLADFEFRLRVRTWRLVAEALGEDPAEAARLVARSDDEGVLKVLEARTGKAIGSLVEERRADARRQLIAERGNPAPHRLL